MIELEVISTSGLVNPRISITIDIPNITLINFIEQTYWNSWKGASKN
ncbi:MAG: hypothetical protein JKX68_01720 [Flavobacteriales bacterium]|nr:hypothetical protein [Flavobacteriales bacterium]